METTTNDTKTILNIGKILVFVPLLIVTIISNMPDLLNSHPLLGLIFSYLPLMVVVGVLVHIPVWYKTASLGIKRIRLHGFTNLLHEFIRNERIIQEKERAKTKLENINPRFAKLRRNHPLAKLVKWHPINLGGSSYHSAKLIKIKNYLMVCPTKFTYLIYTLVILLAALFLHKLPLLIIGLPLDSNISWLFLVLFIAGFVFIAERMISYTIFDKAKKKCLFVKGRMSRNTTNEVNFSSIVALQVISEKIENSSEHLNSQRYQSFELNLILESGRRINILDHGDLNKIVKEAHILSDFLKVPAWKLIYKH